MKNITLAIEEDVLERARLVAAETEDDGQCDGARHFSPTSRVGTSVWRRRGRGFAN